MSNGADIAAAHPAPAAARARWQPALALLLGVVVLQTGLRLVWPIENTDTPHLMAMTAKDLDETLYENDCYFGKKSVYEGYIPAYRWLARWFARAGGSPWAGMVGLFPLVLFVFLFAAWLLFREVMRGVWPAVAFALAASFIRDSGGGAYWGMTFEVEPIARYVFLGPALLGFIPLLRSWPRVSPAAAIFSLGAVGLLANIHPPSAVGWFLMMLVLLLVSSLTPRRKCLVLLLGAGLVVLLASPTILATLRLEKSFTSALTQLPFPEYARHLAQTSEEIFPWVMRPLREVGILPGRQALWLFLAAYVLLMGGWTIRFAMRDRRTRASPASWWRLVLIQLPFVFILSRLRAVDLCLVGLIYALAVWQRTAGGEEDTVSRLDWLAAALLASVTGVCWVGAATLRLVWQLGGLRALTPLVPIFSRCSRFIYLPLWLLAALWVTRRASRATALPLALLFCAFLYPWREQPAFFLMTLAGACGTELYARGKAPPMARAWLDSVMVAILALGVLSYGHGMVPWRFRIVACAGVFTVVLVTRLLRRSIRAAAKRGVLSATLNGVLAAIVAVGLAVALPGGGREYKRFCNYARSRITVRPEQAVRRAMFDWARTNTPKQALFYVSVKDRLGLEFRAFAARAICHTRKHSIENTPPFPVPADYARRAWAYFEKPYAERNPNLLFQFARRAGADYVILPNDLLPAASRPAAYAGDTCAVIALTPHGTPENRHATP